LYFVVAAMFMVN